MSVTAMLSATAWYADVAVAVFFALLILAGILRGFAKSTKGFLVSVFIVCISLLLMGVTHESALGSGMGTGIHDKLMEKSADWGLAFNSPVYIDDDGTVFVVVEGQNVELNAAEFGTKGAFAKFFAEKFVTENGVSVAESAVNSITSVCVFAILFVIYVAAITLLFMLLRMLCRPLLDTQSTGLRLLDKSMGVVFNLVVGLVFVWIVFAVIASLQDKIPSAHSALSDSAFAGLLYRNNPIATVFLRIFG